MHSQSCSMPASERDGEILTLPREVVSTLRGILRAGHASDRDSAPAARLVRSKSGDGCIYADYRAPHSHSSLPERVWIDTRPNGKMVVGWWRDCGTDDIKLCASELGAELTVAAWSGRTWMAHALPLPLKVDDLAGVPDAAELRALLQHAANSVALHLNFAYDYRTLANRAEFLHPGLAALLRYATFSSTCDRVAS